MKMFCVTLQVCGVPGVIPDGIKLLRTNGIYVLVGMVHPHSKLDITGEQIIRKCITIKGKDEFVAWMRVYYRGSQVPQTTIVCSF